MKQGNRMRMLGLVVGLLVTVSMSAAAQASGQGDARQDSTYAQGYRPYSPDHSPSNDSRPGNTNTDTARTVSANADPYLQRYYSETEGWTYYTLPKSSSEPKSDDE
jgi:hypothetical protein